MISVLTPYYKEDVLYSDEELKKENEDGISILFYLQKIYPGKFYLPACFLHLVPWTETYTCFDCMLDEWTNFLERIGEPKLGYNDKDKMELIRQWVSYRGQTLSRTGWKKYHTSFSLFSIVSIYVS